MRTDGKDCTLVAGILLSLLTYLIILRRHLSPHYPAIYWNLGALTTLEMADESSFESEYTPRFTLIMDDEESLESDFSLKMPVSFFSRGCTTIASKTCLFERLN